MSIVAFEDEYTCRIVYAIFDGREFIRLADPISLLYMPTDIPLMHCAVHRWSPAYSDAAGAD